MRNFEEFVMMPDGAVHRFRSAAAPDGPAIVTLIEESLSDESDLAQSHR